MIKRIDHVSIAVGDLEKARSFFVDGLGGRQLFSCPFPPQKFRWTTIEMGSSCLVELVDPLEPEGFVHRFLERRGEGVHHVTFHVDDVHETQRTLEEKGIPTFGLSEDLPGWKEVFVSPKVAFGTLLQFAEFDPLDWIEPGYVPAAYRDFAPPDRIEAGGGDPIEVRRAGAAHGDKIEIRHGGQSIRIPVEAAGQLARALAAQGQDPTPPGPDGPRDR